MKKLELFVMNRCPFCEYVLDYLQEIDLEIPVYDITTDPDRRMQLLRVGGKLQAPCLFIDGEPLYESQEIVEYLKMHK